MTNKLKTSLALSLIVLTVSGCNLNRLPQKDCGDGYVFFEQTGKCIKPGMSVLPGAVEGTVLGLGSVAAL